MKIHDVKMPYDAALRRIDEIQAAIDRADNTDVESAIALGMARDALVREQAALNQQPLTLDEIHAHLSKRHPNDIEPLYVMFEPPIPLDYAPRWRDAGNLSLLMQNGEEYGKTWLAYRTKPEGSADHE